ncbi:hypothetical protein RCH23_000355 [Cryobacterium sp. CAN_C3]|nr:hypothetical protein [Cryobacterium sp. CAN_C3]
MAAMNSPSIRLCIPIIDYLGPRRKFGSDWVSDLGFVAALYGGVQSYPSTPQQISSQPHWPATKSSTIDTR